MSRNFLPELKHNNYYEAFNIYADLSETVRPALAANSYIKENSLNVTRSEDQFLYSTVNKTAKAKETSSSSSGGSSTHTSSSGRTHGGTGGKF